MLAVSRMTGFCRMRTWRMEAFRAQLFFICPDTGLFNEIGEGRKTRHSGSREP